MPLTTRVLEPAMTFADAPDPLRTRLAVTAGDEAGRAICEDAAGCIETGRRVQTGLETQRDENHPGYCMDGRVELPDGEWAIQLFFLEEDGEPRVHSLAAQ